MPLLILSLVSLGLAAATALVVVRWTRRRFAATRPTVVAAEAAGVAVARHLPVRAGVRAVAPETATGLALTMALILAIGGGVLLGVLAFVVRSNPNLLGIDASVANWAHDHATSTSTAGLNAVTQLGTTVTVLVAGTLIAIIDYRRTHRLWAVAFLVVVIAGEKLLTTTIKDLTDRVRPSLNPVAATLGPSFPSGHSATAAAFFAAAALLLGRRRGLRARAAFAGLAVGIAVAVATSRVMLDVHWLTDVMGGLALGWAWFAACAIAFGGRLLRFGAGAEIAANAEHRRPRASTASA